MNSMILRYKGYHSKPEYSYEDGVIHGKIEGIADLVTYESDSTDPVTVEREFQESVDAYLEFCEEVGKSPDKEYSGTFNVRIKPELHRGLACCAFENESTLNQEVENAIDAYLKERGSNMLEAEVSKSRMKDVFGVWDNPDVKSTLRLISGGLNQASVQEG